MSIFKLVTMLYNLLATMSPTVRGVLAVATLLISFSTYLNTVWSSVFAKLDALAAVAVGAADFSPMGLVNTCVPLDTMLTLIGAYAVLRLSCAGIRMVKSFIPTVA